MYLQELLNVCDSRQSVLLAHEGGEVQGNAAALLNMLDKKVLACEVAFVTTIVIDDTTSIPVIRVVTKE